MVRKTVRGRIADWITEAITHASVRRAVTDWVRDAVKGVVNALGASGNAFGLTVSGGDLYLRFQD